jgi:hypothetical protein
MKREILSAGEFRNLPEEDAAAQLQDAELLGSFNERVSLGQSFELITRAKEPRFIERPYGKVWQVEDRGDQPMLTYIFTRVSESEDPRHCHWFMRASDANMPVELHGAATACSTNLAPGVVKRGMRFIVSQAGLAVPESIDEAGEPGGDVFFYHIPYEQRVCYLLGPVHDVIWPGGSDDRQPSLQSPTIGGVAESYSNRPL